MKHPPSWFWFYKEYVVATLAIVSVSMLIVDLVFHLSPDQMRAAYIYDIIVGFVFIAEFFYELRLCRHKGTYFRHYWYFLLAGLPLPYSFVQWLRLLRIIRVFKFARFGSHYTYEKQIKGM